MPVLNQQAGYSLFELIVALVIVAILATATLRTLQDAGDISRFEETRNEMDNLAWAIAGQKELTTGGNRTDFGYIGDVGALPPNLTALVQNPGAYATWKGPYLQDKFYSSTSASASEYAYDAWGKPYIYNNTSIVSTGSGSNLTREIAQSVNDLLYNSVRISVTSNGTLPPGAIYKDSVSVVLTYPNGLGATTSVTKKPLADGSVVFDSIPIGVHDLRIIYLPNSDTVLRKVPVNQGQTTYLDGQYISSLENVLFRQIPDMRRNAQIDKVLA